MAPRVSVRSGAETVGVLAAYNASYRGTTEHQLHLLNILAEHAAVAIQNVRRAERDRHLALTDPLTGLANSRCLIKHLDRLTLVEQGRGMFGVVMLDLDGFKSVNDTYGHLTGDEVLRSVAGRLLENASLGPSEKT